MLTQTVKTLKTINSLFDKRKSVNKGLIFYGVPYSFYTRIIFFISDNYPRGLRPAGFSTILNVAL